LVFTDHKEIVDVLALSSGKLVEATLPDLEFCASEARYSGPAVVTRLTPLGRSVAERYSQLQSRGPLRQSSEESGMGRLS
jgi:hypothetical protein